MRNDGTRNVRQGLLLFLAAACGGVGIILASGYAWAQGSAAVARPARAPRPAPATPLEMALRLERELARGAGILMPDPERPARLDGGLIPLNGNRNGFPAAFLDGLAPETRNGVGVWRAVLHADDASGDMLFYNSAGEHFWTVSANAGPWSADWIARLHTPDGRVADFFSTEQRYQELRARPARVEVPDKVLRRSAWLGTRQYFRPSRVEMTFTFILQDDLADYRSAAASSRSQASGGAPQRSPAALTGLSLTGIACGTNGVTLSAAWPTNTVISGSALDIFFSRSLLPQAWTNRWWAAVEPAAGGVDITIPQSGLPPVPDAPSPACFTNIAPSAYDPGVTYTNIVCTNAVRPAVSGFFRLADLADTDGDGLTGAAEIWTHGTNPGLADTDGDGLTDGAEIALGTLPLNPDTDGDGMPDGWEHQHGLDPLNDDADDDHDWDTLPNLLEYHIGTSPVNRDTDGDGIQDEWEYNSALDPLNAADAADDSDSDGLTNLVEYLIQTHPHNPDTDGDGLADGWDPQPKSWDDADTDGDGDGYPLWQELFYGTSDEVPGDVAQILTNEAHIPSPSPHPAHTGEC